MFSIKIHGTTKNTKGETVTAQAAKGTSSASTLAEAIAEVAAQVKAVPKDKSATLTKLVIQAEPESGLKW